VFRNYFKNLCISQEVFLEVEVFDHTQLFFATVDVWLVVGFLSELQTLDTAMHQLFHHDVIFGQVAKFLMNCFESWLVDELVDGRVFD